MRRSRLSALHPGPALAALGLSLACCAAPTLYRVGPLPADWLRVRVRAGDLVLFVGAGLSIAAGLPSPLGLVERAAAYAKQRGVEEEKLAEIAVLDHRAGDVDTESEPRPTLRTGDSGAPEVRSPTSHTA